MSSTDTTPAVDPTTVPSTAVGYGFLTIAGTIAAALLGFAAALAAVLNGDHSNETIGALIAAAGVLATVLRERGRQSATKIEAAGKVQAVLAAAATAPPPPVARLLSTGVAGRDVPGEPIAAAPSQALVPPESEEYSGADYPPTDDGVDDDVPDDVEFASPPPPADEGVYDDDVDVDDVLPVSVPDFAEQPGETERPESGVVPDAPAPASDPGPTTVA